MFSEEKLKKPTKDVSGDAIMISVAVPPKKQAGGGWEMMDAEV